MNPGVHLPAAYLSLCNHLGQALLAKNAHFSGFAVNKAVFHVKQLEVSLFHVEHVSVLCSKHRGFS
jgi:hypothetical protein